MKMKDKHIDDMTMSLYLGGGSSLRKDLVEWVQLHLNECDLCSKKLETKLNEMADQQKSKDSEESNLEFNVLNRIAALLSLPLKSPSCWDKLKGLCNQLVDTLSDFEDLNLQSTNTQRLSLVTKGYEYTTPSSEKKKDEDKTKESQEQIEIGEKMLLLQEILGDEEISLSKRIALSEELLLYANKKSRKLKGSSSLKTKKPHEKKCNNSS